MQKNLISFLIFICLINITFNPISLFFGVGIFTIVLLIALCISSNHQYLFPFYVYPFFIIIKQEDSNLIISMLPEICILISLVFFLLDAKLSTYQKRLFHLLILFSFSTTVISIIHIFKIHYLPSLLKQFVLPILFLIIFINASLKKIELPIEALKISIISFSIVSVIALLNYYDVVEMIDYTNLKTRKNILCEYNISNLIVCTDIGYSQRLDPLISGSIGSIAAVLWGLGIISILMNDTNYYLKYFSIPIFASGFLTLSNSILFPIIYLFLVHMISYKKYLKLYIIFSVIFAIIILTNFEFFSEDSLIDYYNRTIISAIKNHFSKIGLIDILFGSGPIINSSVFRYFPTNFVVDAGIFRLLLETGIINFILYFIILINILKKGIWLTINFPSMYNKSLLLMLMVLLSLIHVNAIFTPPFFCLFVVAVSGIIVQYKLRKNENL